MRVQWSKQEKMVNQDWQVKMEDSVTILEVVLTSLVNNLQKGGEGEKERYKSDSQVSCLSFSSDEWT